MSGAETKSSGTARGLIKPVVFTVIAVIMTLAVLELAARFAGYGPPETSAGYQESKFRPHKNLLWELTPGWNGMEGEGRIRINSMGFRDDETPVPTPPNETRILALGDSVTFGYLVGQEQPWPKALERIYRGSGRDVRVINAGVPGYSTFQEREQLHLKGWEIEPDVVILAYCLNDATERYTALAEYGGKDVFLGVDTSRRLPFLQRLTRKSAILRLITGKFQDKARNDEIYSVQRLFETPLRPEIEEAWERNREEIIAISNDVKEKDGKFLLVIFPYFFQFLLKKNQDLHQQRILEVCEAHGIKCLDLFTTFYRHGDRGLFIDGNHLTPEGHLLAAQTIYETLETMK